VRADFGRRKPPSRAGWALLALLLAAAAALCGAAWRQQAQVDLLSARAEQDRREAEDARQRAREAIAPPAPYEASARAMLRERASPWPLALTALETVAVAGVTPGAIEIIAREAAVNVELNFSNHERLLEYVQALNAGVGEGDVAWRWTLTSAQAQADGSGVARVRGAVR
jgi:hypothetical protein